MSIRLSAPVSARFGRLLGSSSCCLAALVGVVVGTGGCAYGEARQVVRAQFAADLSCPEAKVEDRKPFEQDYKEGQYITRGCGQVRTYTCPTDDGLIEYGGTECSFVEGDNSQMAKPATSSANPGEAMMDDGSDMADDTGGDMGGDTAGDMGGDANEGMDNNAGAGDAPAEETPAKEKPEPKSEKKKSPFKASGNFKVGK